MAYKRKRTRLTPTTYRTTIYKTDGSTHTSVTTKVANQTWTESERGRTHTVNTDGWITRKDYRKKKRKIPKFDFSFLFGKKKKSRSVEQDSIPQILYDTKPPLTKEEIEQQEENDMKALRYMALIAIPIIIIIQLFFV